MAEYIEREAAIELLAMALDDDWEPEYATDRMNEILAADVRPVVRGRWDDKSVAFFFKCSMCGCCVGRGVFLDWGKLNYCPNCGADMRETNDEKA